MIFKYSKDDFKEEIHEYLRISNNPYQGSIIWQGYLFGLVAGNLLDIKDYNDLLSILPTKVSISLEE